MECRSPSARSPSRCSGSTASGRPATWTPERIGNPDGRVARAEGARAEGARAEGARAEGVVQALSGVQQVDDQPGDLFFHPAALRTERYEGSRGGDEPREGLSGPGEQGIALDAAQGQEQEGRILVAPEPNVAGPGRGGGVRQHALRDQLAADQPRAVGVRPGELDADGVG